jgi:hypothetical protein
MKRTSRFVDLDAENGRTEEKAQIYAEVEGISGIARLYTCELSRAVSDAKTLQPSRLRLPSAPSTAAGARVSRAACSDTVTYKLCLRMTRLRNFT